jgi:hypothetical protein
MPFFYNIQIVMNALVSIIYAGISPVTNWDYPIGEIKILDIGFNVVSLRNEMLKFQYLSSRPTVKFE